MSRTFISPLKITTRDIDGVDSAILSGSHQTRASRIRGRQQLQSSLASLAHFIHLTRSVLLA